MPGQAVLGYVGIAKQQSFGESISPSNLDSFFKAYSESLTIAYDRIEIANITDARPLEPDDMAGVRRINGDLVVAGDPVTIGHLLNGALGQGSKTITVVVSGVLWETAWMPSTTEVFSLSPQPLYNIHVFRDVTSASVFIDTCINRLQLGIQINQDLRATAGLLARDHAYATNVTPTIVSSPTFPFAFDRAEISIDGAVSGLLTGLTVTLDNQLESVATIVNTQTITRYRRRGPVQVRVAGTMIYEDQRELTAFLNQTERRFVVTFTRPASFRLILDMPRVVYDTFPVGMAGREFITVGFTGIARVHQGSGTPISVRLTTTKSNY